MTAKVADATLALERAANEQWGRLVSLLESSGQGNMVWFMIIMRFG